MPVFRLFYYMTIRAGDFADVQLGVYNRSMVHYQPKGEVRKI